MENGQTPAIFAAYLGNLDILKLLVAYQANVYDYSKPLLTIAANKGNQDMVKYLLELKVDVNAFGTRQGSALLAAVDNGNVNIADLLIKAGANVNMVTEYINYTPLVIACHQKNLEMVKLLVQAKAITRKFSDNLRYFPLYIAINTKNLELVTYLMDHGADVNDYMSDGETSLMRACKLHLTRIVHYLLSKGAYLHAVNNNHQSLLMKTIL
eukprot:CAMPEP_0117430770 /NCGR_PEP_ID=MMETSP0758-20121206/10321_1 /TAXON_ID=63605 /ORGANISM="Percolomonas cosmopolitus, Strain AE-1 (ATCC 50343)" /LENGTH=210 /DNA_ID=CAMNT_0005219145 /DNA_START=308 /DNA_END=940 /DNA_ORIENTATION=+